MIRGKLKFAQTTRGESNINFVICCHEGSKPNNLQITRLKLKIYFF